MASVYLSGFVFRRGVEKRKKIGSGDAGILFLAGPYQTIQQLFLWYFAAVDQVRLDVGDGSYGFRCKLRLLLIGERLEEGLKIRCGFFHVVIITYWVIIRQEKSYLPEHLPER
jgi:hypothetical protein